MGDYPDPAMVHTSDALSARVDAVRARMRAMGVDTLMLSLGADLPWLTGYTAMPLERLTMLILPLEGEAVLVVPRLEAARVEPHPELFSLRPWAETENPNPPGRTVKSSQTSFSRVGVLPSEL